jgi:hypothetical protein
VALAEDEEPHQAPSTQQGRRSQRRLDSDRYWRDRRRALIEQARITTEERDGREYIVRHLAPQFSGLRMSDRATRRHAANGSANWCSPTTATPARSKGRVDRLRDDGPPSGAELAGGPLVLGAREPTPTASCARCNYGGGSRVPAQNTPETIERLRVLVEEQQQIAQMAEKLARHENDPSPEPARNRQMPRIF